MQIIMQFNRKYCLALSIIFKEFGLQVVFRTWAERFCHKLGHAKHQLWQNNENIFDRKMN